MAELQETDEPSNRRAAHDTARHDPPFNVERLTDAQLLSLHGRICTEMRRRLGGT